MVHKDQKLAPDYDAMMKTAVWVGSELATSEILWHQREIKGGFSPGSSCFLCWYWPILITISST